MTVPRYLPTYRQDETTLIHESAFRGESLCFVGVAGVGKSNLINFLRGRGAVPTEDAGKITYCYVDATTWQHTPAHLWQLMDAALLEAAKGLSPTFQESTVVSISEERRTLDRLRSRLQWTCHTLGCQVVFVLDDFDVVFEQGPLSMLEQLNAFRSEGNRGLLSYLVFTKRLPHVSARHYDLESRSKFFDLFRHSQYALQPHPPEDARQMLNHLNSTVLDPLGKGELPRIQVLAGGHARLMRILFDVWVGEGPPLAKDIEMFLVDSPAVRRECQRIWENLHVPEREVAICVAKGIDRIRDSGVVDHLRRRGLLVGDNPHAQLQWFSPLMRHFLRSFPVPGGDDR